MDTTPQFEKQSSGFALVEVILVVVILALLSSVSVLGYTNYVNNSTTPVNTLTPVDTKTAVDLQTLSTLNTAAKLYDSTAILGQKLNDLSNDDKRMLRLYEHHLTAAKLIVPQTSGYVFVWDKTTSQWVYQKFTKP